MNFYNLTYTPTAQLLEHLKALTGIGAELFPQKEPVQKRIDAARVEKIKRELWRRNGR